MFRTFLCSLRVLPAAVLILRGGEAGELFEVDMDRNWIFVYEVLSVNDLNEEWKFLKKNGVSFLQPKFHY